MTPDERERMAILCQRIATEKNPEIFNNLVRQLNDLLESNASASALDDRTKPI
jgi:hypothetical protein